MRSLKSWYVQVERIKGEPDEYLGYLLDKRRHRGQTITPLGDVKTATEILNEDKVWFHSQMKRGGHIPSPAYSLLISFPFEASNEQWRNLNDKVLSSFYRTILEDNGIEDIENALESLKIKSVAVIHKGNHCHFMLPKILREPKVVLDLSKKRYSYLLKSLTEQYAKEIIGISKTDYMISDDYRVKSASEARADARRAEVIEPLWKDLLNFAKLAEQRGDKALASSIQKKFLTYTKQIENDNHKRAERTLSNAQKLASNPNGGVGGKTPTM